MLFFKDDEKCNSLEISSKVQALDSCMYASEMYFYSTRLTALSRFYSMHAVSSCIQYIWMYIYAPKY